MGQLGIPAVIYCRGLANLTVTVCSSSKAGGGAVTRGAAVLFSAGWVVCGKGPGRGVNCNVSLVNASGEGFNGTE